MSRGDPLGEAGVRAGDADWADGTDGGGSLPRPDAPSPNEPDMRWEHPLGTQRGAQAVPLISFNHLREQLSLARGDPPDPSHPPDPYRIARMAAVHRTRTRDRGARPCALLIADS